MDDTVAAVEQALSGLGWTLDRRDWDGARRHLDGTVRTDYTRVFGGEPQSQSGDALVAQWRELLGRLAATQHLVVGVRVTGTEGDASRATANVVGTHLGTDDRMWTVGGWWDTELRRDGDRYLISAITLHPSWQTGDIGVMSAG